MKIALVATHSFPIPHASHTGDVVILDLAHGLNALGHDVTLFAPSGTQWPSLCEMPASYGKAPPWSWDCEQQCYAAYQWVLENEFDIVHDFSATKRIVEKLTSIGKRNVISTLLGGVWTHPDPPINICVWSHAMRNRGLRGETDYAGTLLADMGGPPQKPIKDAHVVYGGIDTEWYHPVDVKKNFFLWMNRWHPAKGYKQAIEIARRTGREVVMAGEHPDRELFEYQKNCALEAIELAKGLPNVHFEWLPADPDHHTRKRELYSQAQALLYTVQFQEPFGLSQVEAMACGTPVIGTNYGSVPEVVTHGVTGVVCENNTDAFAAALNDTWKVPSWRVRGTAVGRFDRLIMAANYVKEYEAVLAGNGWG